MAVPTGLFTQTGSREDWTPGFTPLAPKATDSVLDPCAKFSSPCWPPTGILKGNSYARLLFFCSFVQMQLLCLCEMQAHCIAAPAPRTATAALEIKAKPPPRLSTHSSSAPAVKQWLLPDLPRPPEQWLSQSSSALQGEATSLSSSRQQEGPLLSAGHTPRSSQSHSLNEVNARSHDMPPQPQILLIHGT